MPDMEELESAVARERELRADLAGMVTQWDALRAEVAGLRVALAGMLDAYRDATVGTWTLSDAERKQHTANIHAATACLRTANGSAR